MNAPFVPEKLPIELTLEPLIPMIAAANRALASFEGVLHGLRNRELLLAPMTTREAVLSSRIEGTQASLGEVLQYEAGSEPLTESAGLDIQEISNYRTALQRAEDELAVRPFNLNLLLDLHRVLLDSVRGRDKGIGRFRTVQNWIGSTGTPMERAEFVPPEPQRLMGLLDDWEKYYHSDQPDMLVQLAIVHGQFEIIHPFLDGNGRLGRILIPLFLYERKLLGRPVFYLSAYLEEHKDEYIHRLRALGQCDGAWREWVAFFLTAIVQQANVNVTTARAIIDLYEEMKARVLRLTRSQFAVPLLDALFERPIISMRTLDGRPGFPTRQVIHALLKRLQKDGILESVSAARGARPQVFAFPELLKLCEGR